MTSVLALVTARAGSKRLPRKNLACIGRETLTSRAWWVLNQLRMRVPLTMRLSTDSQEIADTWPAADRPLEMRPAWLATDTAKSVDVCTYEVWQQKQKGVNVDVVLLLQPTSPLVWWSDLDHVLAGVREYGSAVGVSDQTSKPFGIWAVTPNYMRMHSQVCVEGECTKVAIPHERCADIDTQEDLDAARAVWEEMGRVAWNTVTTDGL